MAFGAAEAVLTVEALAVVGAPSSSVFVLIQTLAIEIGLATFVHRLDASSGRRRGSGGSTQGQSTVSEIALLFGLAVGERVGVPQTIGIGKTSNAVLVIIAAVVTTTGQTSSLAATVAEGALTIHDASSTLSRNVGTARGGARSDGVVAKLTRPSTSSRTNTVLAVVKGTS